VTRLAASVTPNPTTAPAFGPSARERLEACSGWSAFHRRGRMRPGAEPCGAGDRQRPFVRTRITPRHELDSKRPAVATTTYEPFETRHCPSTSANRRETRAHPRAIRNPARRRLAPYGGWPHEASGRRAKAEASFTGRADRLEHAHGCAEARTNRRRAPLVAADSADDGWNRRRRSPGRDRLTEPRANVRTRGEVEVPSSRRRSEPKPEPSLALPGDQNALFATAQRGPSTGAP